MNVVLELIKIYKVVTTRHRTGVLRLWGFKSSTVRKFSLMKFGGRVR